MTALVVDASVAATWLFAEQASPSSHAVLDVVKSGTLVAPTIWLYENANIAARAVLKGKASVDAAADFLQSLHALPLRIVPASASDVFGDAVAIAVRRKLSVYDAAYVAVAARENLPLATFDRDLAAAAEAEGVPLFPPR
jgi:predicted nucleic acid-binding protein